jgi:3-hydroxybutyryl-CoA dehydrogenase
MSTPHLLVVGAGQMGAGIAQVALVAGVRVTLVDAHSASLQAGEKRIAAGLSKLLEKGKLTAEARTEAQARLSMATALDPSLGGADFAIEAVSENENLKREIFTRLDTLVREGGVLASNTSSIPITRLGAATRRPDAVIGMHFMNPVPLMPLVEIILGAATSNATHHTTRQLAERMGKSPVVSQDRAGFIVNRILMPMLNEAAFSLMEGLGSAEDIDTAMKLGTNQPMGPLALADFIGLDTCLAILEVMHRHLGEDKYRPCPLLRQYVDAGWLGKKSGRGFFVYAGGR